LVCKSSIEAEGHSRYWWEGVGLGISPERIHKGLHPDKAARVSSTRKKEWDALENPTLFFPLLVFLPIVATILIGRNLDIDLDALNNHLVIVSTYQ